MEITRVEEYRIDAPLKRAILELLREAFPALAFSRIYYKLPPRFRLLAWVDGELAGQVGVDYRVIRAGEEPATIFGVVDLCVASAHRRKGVGTALLQRLESLAREAGAGHVVLFADDHRVYLANGYVRAGNVCRWVGIHEHRMLGIQEKPLDDCLMVKRVGESPWPSGTIDLLGHLF